MRTGIIGAMKEEIFSLKEEFSEIKTITAGCRNIYHGKIGDEDVVMAISGWGKVAAASTATSLINLFNVDRIVFVGLAGSLQKHLKIGDIIVGNKLIQHDVNLSGLDFPDVKPPFRDNFVFDVPEKCIGITERTVRKFSQNLKAGLYPDLPMTYHPDIYTGAIGTGDIFVSSEEHKKAITEKYPEILCTEMEGAAIAQVAADYNLPYMVIRIISDQADDEAAQAFTSFLFHNIGRISVEMIKILLLE